VPTLGGPLQQAGISLVEEVDPTPGGSPHLAGVLVPATQLLGGAQAAKLAIPFLSVLDLSR
jgi:hypothetical protein